MTTELKQLIEAECAKVPEGYALISIAQLKTWGCYEALDAMCQYPLAAAPKAQEGVPFKATVIFDDCTKIVEGVMPAQAEKQEPVKDAPAYTFHIDETGKAYLKGFCVSKEGDPLYARPQPDLTAEVEKLRAGLENCRLFAARHRKEDWALLILGFCAEAGVVGSVTR